MGALAIIGKILGSGDVIKQGFDLIDDMHTSDVEAIEAKTKAKTELLTAYAPFKVAQRYLALMFAFTFLVCFVMVMGLTIFSIGNLVDIRAVINEFYIAEIMSAIIVFYFGGGFAEGVLKAKK